MWKIDVFCKKNKKNACKLWNYYWVLIFRSVCVCVNQIPLLIEKYFWDGYNKTRWIYISVFVLINQ
jgi:hypothetical protein